MRGSKSELFAAPRVSRRQHIGAVWQARLNITEECHQFCCNERLG
jgi:hypothetical protein